MQTFYAFKIHNSSDTFRENRATERETIPAVGETVELQTEIGPRNFTVTKIGRYRETEFYATRTIYVKPNSPTVEMLSGLRFRPIEEARLTNRCTICGKYLGRHNTELFIEHFRIASEHRIPGYVKSHREDFGIRKALGVKTYREFRKALRDGK